MLQGAVCDSETWLHELHGFMASCYWTDGANDHSLMSTDGGLQMCECGTAFVLVDAISLGIDASEEIPDTAYVQSDQLRQIIATPNHAGLR